MIREQLKKHPYSSRDALLARVEARHGGRDGHDRTLAAIAAAVASPHELASESDASSTSDEHSSDADDYLPDDKTTHIVLNRSPAAERAAPRIRSIISDALATIAPRSYSGVKKPRVTIAWKLPDSLDSELSRVPK